MNNAAKKWYSYVFMVFGLAVLAASALVPYFLTNGESWPKKYVCYMLIFGGVAFVLLSFIAQDLYRGWKRHKLHDWDNPLPEEIVNKAWLFFYPFLTSGLISFVVGVITYLIIK